VAADQLELLREHRVGVHVRQDDEAVREEHLGGPQRLHRIGQQVARIRDHLELDPVGKPPGARQPRHPHRLLRRLGAGGVREEQHLLGEERGDVLARGVEVDAAHRDRDHLAAGRLDGVAHALERVVLAGAEDQPRPKRPARDRELVHSVSLRWHDPDQVLRSRPRGRLSAPAQGLPLREA
jgi:hypothetical protein